MCKWEYFNALKFMFPDFSDTVDVEESFVSLHIILLLKYGYITELVNDENMQ